MLFGLVNLFGNKMLTKATLLLWTLGTVTAQTGKCDQTPIGAQVLTPADTRNAPFLLRIDTKNNKFHDFQTYILILEATNDSRPFKEFMITVEDPTVDDSPYEFEHTTDVGTLKTLDDDSKSRYSERCFSSVENTDNSDKDRIETHWVSPKQSVRNQRIRFRAMVAENKEKWYAGDKLTIILEKNDAVSLDAPPHPPNATCNLCSEARYEVIFTGQWSRLTHPNKYPSKPDDNGYTHMIGASHAFNHTLWKTGVKAEPGLRALVTNGDTEIMEKEIIQAMSESGGTRTLILGKRRRHPHMSEPSHALFRVDRVHHLFSLVVGMRPSPDWFLGTKLFELCTDQGWLKYSEIPLYPYDAGIMNGISYDSPRSVSNPEDNVDRVAVGSFNKESPFYQMNLPDMAPFAFLEVNRLNVYPLEEEECQDDGVGTLEPVDDYKISTVEERKNGEQGEIQDQPQAAESKHNSCEFQEQWSRCSPDEGSCGRGVQIKGYYKDLNPGEPSFADGRSPSDGCPEYSTFETRECYVNC